MELVPIRLGSPLRAGSGSGSLYGTSVSFSTPSQTDCAGDGAARSAFGAGRATVYEVGDGGFLIGSVPGCDLRLPGSNLPPIICLIARGAAAATLRRLAPVLPILVNGKAVASAHLQRRRSRHASAPSRSA